MSVDKIQVKETLHALNDAEVSIRAIISSASETSENLASMPACSEKKLKALAGQYLSNVRNVQEILKNHSHILDIRRDGNETGMSRSLNAGLEQKAEYEKRLAELDQD